MRCFLLIFPIWLRRVIPFFLLTLSLSAIPIVANSQVVFLNGGTSGTYDFQDPLNWNTGVPTINDIVEINVTANVTIENIPNLIQFDELRLTGTGTLTFRFQGAPGDDAELFLGDDDGMANAFTLASTLTLVLSGDVGAAIILPSSDNGAPNVATISGTIKLAPSDPNVLFRLLVQDEDVLPSFFLTHGIWNFESGSRLEIGGGASDDNFADDYPFSGATITTYGGRMTNTDTRNNTHIFKSGSTLVQYDGLDPSGPSTINKCVFETGSTFEFADNKVQDGAKHRPSFTRRIYSHYRFSSTSKVYNETLVSSGVFPDDSCVTDDFEIVSHRLTFANRGSFRLIIKGDLKLPSGGVGDNYLLFDPPAFIDNPDPAPDSAAGNIQFYFDNSTPKSITGGSLIRFITKSNNFPIEVRSGTINCNAFIEVNRVGSSSYSGFFVAGRLNMIGEYYISGTADFNMRDGSILGIGSASGINATPASSGNIRCENNLFNSQQARYIYMGSLAPQNTGTGLPSWTGAFNGVVLEIDKSSATDVVTLNIAASTTQVHELVLTSGRFNLNNKTLEVTVAGAGSVNGKITATASGNLQITGQGTVILEGSTDITAASDLDFFNLHTINTAGFGTLPYNINFLGAGAHRVHNQLLFRSNNIINNPPFYATGSTLIYDIRNGGTAYSAGSEWSNGVFAATDRGVPHHVQIGLTTGGGNNTRVNIGGDKQCLGDLIVGDPLAGTSGHQVGFVALGTLRIGGNFTRNITSTIRNANLSNSLVVFNGSSEQIFTDNSSTDRSLGLPRVEINNASGIKLNSAALTVVAMVGTSGNVLRLLNGNMDINGGYVILASNGGNIVAEGGIRRITNSNSTQGQFSIAGSSKTFTSASGGSWIIDNRVTLIAHQFFNFGAGGIVTINDSLIVRQASGGFTNSPIYADGSTLVYAHSSSTARTQGSEWAAGSTGTGVPFNVHIGPGNGYLHVTGFAGNVTGNNDSRFTISLNQVRRCRGSFTLGSNNGTTGHQFNLTSGASTELQIGGNWVRHTNGTFTHNDRLVTFNGTGNQTITVAGGGTETFGLLQVNKTAGELRLSSSPATNVSVAATAGTALLQMNNVGALNLQGQTLNIAGTAASSGIAVTGSGVRSILSSPGTGFVNFSSAAANRGITSSGGATLTFGTGVAVNLNTAVNFGTSISTIQGQLRMNAGGIVNTNPPFYDNNSYLIYNTTGTASPATEWLAGSESTSAFGVPHHVQVGLTAGGNNSKAEINTNYRFLKGDMIIGDGSSGTGYELIMSGSGVLRVGGNWTRYNNGMFTRGTRQVVFKTASNATINAAGGETFYDLRIEKDDPSNSVTLGSVVSVENILDLDEGHLISDLTNYLFISNPSLGAITGGGADSYVEGPLRRRADNITGGSEMEFPVGYFDGSNHHFKPVILRNVTSSNLTTTAYQATYYRSNAPKGTPNYFFSGFIQGILQNQYWRFESFNATAGDGILVLNYEDPFSGNPFMDIAGASLNPAGVNDEVGIVRKQNTNPASGTYETTNPSGTLDLGSTPPEALNHLAHGNQIATHPGTVFNNHLFFTLGWALNKLLILPIQLLSFEASLQAGNSSLLTWQIADDKDLQQFEVEVSRDGQRFTKLTGMGRNGTQYTYRHTGLQSGVYYYRLHILGKDGSRAYSKVQMVQVGVNVTVIQGLLQNPVQGGRALVKVYSATPQDAFATVVDHAGRVLLRQKIALTKGNNLAPLSVLPLMPGMYRLQLQTADGVQQTMPFVK